jgi:hypothetical protein
VSKPYEGEGGCGTHLALVLQDNLALVRDARKNTLLKDKDILLVKTEVVALLEELLRRTAGRTAGHDIPGDGGGGSTVSL